MNKVTYLIVALILLAAGSAFATSPVYEVYVNTSAIAGQSGYLDFQFNPGMSSQAALARILNFDPYTGALTGVPLTTGDVAGGLPGAVTINNTTAWNDYYQGFTFGNGLHFSVQLEGPAVTAPTDADGSSFGFSMYAADQVTPLLGKDSNGFAMTAEVTSLGTIATEYGPAASSVPEPSTYALFTLGLAGAVLLRKKTVKM